MNNAAAICPESLAPGIHTHGAHLLMPVSELENRQITGSLPERIMIIFTCNTRSYLRWHFFMLKKRNQTNKKYTK